jgi:predicted DNA-binding transcriptional regulator AlpA
MSHDDLLKPIEAAAYLRLSASTLAKARVRGDGPPFLKLGPKTVLYRRSDIEVWAESRIKQSTSEYTENSNDIGAINCTENADEIDCTNMDIPE